MLLYQSNHMFLSLRDYLHSSRLAVLDHVLSLSLLGGHHNPLLFGSLVDHLWQVAMASNSLYLRMESISMQRGQKGVKNPKFLSKITHQENVLTTLHRARGYFITGASLR